MNDATTKENEMSKQEIIAQATAIITSEPHYHYCPRTLEQTVEAGLLDGDVIGLGQTNGVPLIATIKGVDVEMAHGSKVTTIALDRLSQAQKDSMLKHKAIQKARK
jgi:hypothetical protein